MLEMIIFIVGIAIFSGSSFMFLILKNRNQRMATINTIVSFVTVASYMLMFDGSGTLMVPSGELVYWTRWIFYAGSCSLLMLEISTLMGKDKWMTVEIIASNIIVMLTGALASITEAASKWMFFVFSSIAFGYILYRLREGKTDKFLVTFTTIFWSMFPVAWILSPAGFGILNAAWTALGYLVLDVITKIYFGYHTTMHYQVE
ncbi:schizorhodopsin|nr:schizorhodopsin [Candidatus Bathyarchaeota archaeon]